MGAQHPWNPTPFPAHLTTPFPGQMGWATPGEGLFGVVTFLIAQEKLHFGV
ncbi:hypothetical protein TCCBUS3UF1_7560 [Thermus sp. CCB_US3_UF1]|nr:hypothetical protein TCCBUS3UF1_7560 [Thermus sp. CCB_US3_UF1]